MRQVSYVVHKIGGLKFVLCPKFSKTFESETILQNNCKHFWGVDNYA